MSFESGFKKEENKEMFDRAALEDEVRNAAMDLNDDTRTVLVGDDAWEITEFDAKVDASMHHQPRDEQTLIRMRDILQQLKGLETDGDDNKKDQIKKLGDEFDQL